MVLVLLNACKIPGILKQIKYQGFHLVCWAGLCQGRGKKSLASLQYQHFEAEVVLEQLNLAKEQDLDRSIATCICTSFENWWQSTLKAEENCVLQENTRSSFSNTLPWNFLLQRKLACTTVQAGIEIWANRNRMLSEVAGAPFMASCCGISALCKCLRLKKISSQPVDWSYTLDFQPKFPLKTQMR